MSLPLVAVNMVLSALIGWWYLGWFYDYAQGTVYASYFIGCAIICVILMFLWTPEMGEENRLMLGGFDTGISLKPGTYVLANIAPFFREINLHLGFSITRLQDGRKINNENVNMEVYKDQRRTEYKALVTTSSFFALNFDKFWNNLWIFLLDFKGGHDQIQYYKVGRTAFLFLLVVTTIAKVTHPNNVQVTHSSKTPANSLQQSNLAPVFGNKVTVDVLLKKGQAPIMPDPEKFKMITDEKDTGYLFFIDGRTYITYSEPSIGKIRGLTITESVCPLIPWGKEVVFFTKHPPQYAANVISPISYIKKESFYNLFERSVVAFRKSALGKDTVIEETVPWTNLYDNWNEVEGESSGIKIKARYQKNDEDPRVGGAIVCF